MHHSVPPSTLRSSTSHGRSGSVGLISWFSIEGVLVVVSQRFSRWLYSCAMSHDNEIKEI
jgi:hypothetical protein